MKFKYIQFIGPNDKSIFRAAVPIFFKNKEKFVYVQALVDSGADYTILPIELAGELGLKLSVKDKMEFFGAGNNPFTVYPSLTKITHLIRQDGFRSVSWKSEVYFAESQSSILLGNIGFLDQFKVIFDSKNKELEILK